MKMPEIERNEISRFAQLPNQRIGDKDLEIKYHGENITPKDQDDDVQNDAVANDVTLDDTHTSEEQIIMQNPDE